MSVNPPRTAAEHLAESDRWLGFAAARSSGRDNLAHRDVHVAHALRMAEVHAHVGQLAAAVEARAMIVKAVPEFSGGDH